MDAFFPSHHLQERQGRIQMEMVMFTAAQDTLYTNPRGSFFSTPGGYVNKSATAAKTPGSRFPSDDQKVDLGAITRLFDAFRTVNPTMPIQMAETLLLVAMNEGSNLRDLQAKTQWRMSTISRHLLDLGERNRRFTEGWHLVESRANPNDLRSNEYRLTPKGRELVAQVLQVYETNVENRNRMRSGA